MGITRCRARPATVAALAAVAIAGCGGGGDGSGAASTSTGPAPAPATQGGRAIDLEQRYVSIVSDVSPAVVQIRTKTGLGSGVVYDDNGDIVTNNHVVEGGGSSFVVTLAEGDQHDAKLVGTFPPEDLAVIRLQDGKPPTARFADSAKLQVGQLVLAIGNPLGLRSSVTDGIVSSLGRTVGEGNGAVISSAIQTSASINPGNSGGALVGMDGAVVGIPTLAAVNPELGGQQAPGIGFAIPSNTVKRIAGQIIQTGHVTRSGRAFLGIQAATAMGAPGVLVAAVTKGGPAEKAGIRPGDVIVSVNGAPTPTADELATVLAGLKPGQTVPVEVVHSSDGSREKVQVQLGEQKA